MKKARICLLLTLWLGQAQTNNGEAVVVIKDAVIEEDINNCSNCLDGKCVNETRTCAKCASGHFGKLCRQNCPSNCDYQAGCGIDTGLCGACAPGYHGDKCETLCPAGFHGDRCHHPCPKNCRDGRCHHVTGECLRGCRDGYLGPSCLRVCPAGHYGHDCLAKCPRTCLNNDDDDNDDGDADDTGSAGSADGGDSGFGSPPPPPSPAPPPPASSPCHHKTGACLHGCVAGFRGARCSRLCRGGTYGENCTKSCSPLCLDRLCNSFSGHCTSCRKGKFGPFCEDSTPVDGMLSDRLSSGSGGGGGGGLPKEDELESPKVILASVLGLIGVGLLMWLLVSLVTFYKHKLIAKMARRYGGGGRAVPSWLSTSSMWRGKFANLHGKRQRMPATTRQQRQQQQQRQRQQQRGRRRSHRQRLERAGGSRSGKRAEEEEAGGVKSREKASDIAARDREEGTLSEWSSMSEEVQEGPPRKVRVFDGVRPGWMDRLGQRDAVPPAMQIELEESGTSEAGDWYASKRRRFKPEGFSYSLETPSGDDYSSTTTPYLASRPLKNAARTAAVAAAAATASGRKSKRRGSERSATRPTTTTATTTTASTYSSSYDTTDSKTRDSGSESSPDSTASSEESTETETARSETSPTSSTLVSHGSTSPSSTSSDDGTDSTLKTEEYDDEEDSYDDDEASTMTSGMTATSTTPTRKAKARQVHAGQRSKKSHRPSARDMPTGAKGKAIVTSSPGAARGKSAPGRDKRIDTRKEVVVLAAGPQVAKTHPSVKLHDKAKRVPAAVRISQQSQKSVVEESYLPMMGASPKFTQNRGSPFLSHRQDPLVSESEGMRDYSLSLSSWSGANRGSSEKENHASTSIWNQGLQVFNAAVKRLFPFKANRGGADEEAFAGIPPQRLELSSLAAGRRPESAVDAMPPEFLLSRFERWQQESAPSAHVEMRPLQALGTRPSRQRSRLTKGGGGGGDVGGGGGKPPMRSWRPTALPTLVEADEESCSRGGAATTTDGTSSTSPTAAITTATTTDRASTTTATTTTKTMTTSTGTSTTTTTSDDELSSSGSSSSPEMSWPLVRVGHRRRDDSPTSGFSSTRKQGVADHRGTPSSITTTAAAGTNTKSGTGASSSYAGNTTATSASLTSDATSARFHI